MYAHTASSEKVCSQQGNKVHFWVFKIKHTRFSDLGVHSPGNVFSDLGGHNQGNKVQRLGVYSQGNMVQ